MNHGIMKDICKNGHLTQLSKRMLFFFLKLSHVVKISLCSKFMEAIT